MVPQNSSKWFLETSETSQIDNVRNQKFNELKTPTGAFIDHNRKTI